MPWIRAIIDISQLSPEQHELLLGRLYEQVCIGAEEKEDSLIAYFPECPGMVRQLRSLFRSFPKLKVKIKTIPDEDWLKEWKKGFKPVKVGKCFLIVPPWLKEVKPGKRTLLRIYPGVAFGTGHHASTQLALRALEKLRPFPSRVLDYGTGSGILAIAAEKLGAKQVVAVECDVPSLENARYNLRLNDATRVQLVAAATPALLPPRFFSLIVCNMLWKEMEPLLEVLATRMLPSLDSLIILAGFLREDLRRAELSLRKTNLLVVGKELYQDWVMVSARLRGASDAQY